MFQVRRSLAKGRVRVLAAINVFFALFVIMLLWTSTSMHVGRDERFCDGSSETNPCIFDIGMNTGQDVAQYLKDGKARVLAVEADPNLISKARDRFEQQVATSRLVLSNFALVSLNASVYTDTVPFWVNTKKNYMSSFVERLGCRTPRGADMPKGEHKYCNRVDVPATTCGLLLVKYGTPRYMKIDIEGMDVVCLESMYELGNNIELPRYISVEGITKNSLMTLTKLGYSKFKMVNQNADGKGAKLANSGPWGEDATDLITGNDWISLKEALNRMKNKLDKIKSWSDLHAKLE